MKEKRNYQRIPVRFMAELLSNEKVYQGEIKDVSQEGLGYLITSQIDTSEGFVPEQVIKISFYTPTNEKLIFDCEMMWFVWNYPDNRNLTLGLKIINPSKEYINLIKTIALGQKA